MSGTITGKGITMAILLFFALLSSTAAALPLAHKPTVQCRCALMPHTTPFFPPSAARSGAIDSCAALGPRLHYTHASISDDDEFERLLAAPATQASMLLSGAKSLSADALMRLAGDLSVAGVPGSGHEGRRERVVCRAITVVQDVRHFSESRAAGDRAAQEDRSFSQEVREAWAEPEKHLFALKLVVLVLVLLCLVEIGEEMYMRLRRRSRKQGAIRLGGSEKAWCAGAVPQLESIEEECEGTYS